MSTRQRVRRAVESFRSAAEAIGPLEKDMAEGVPGSSPVFGFRGIQNSLDHFDVRGFRGQALRGFQGQALRGFQGQALFSVFEESRIRLIISMS